MLEVITTQHQKRRQLNSSECCIDEKSLLRNEEKYVGNTKFSKGMKLMDTTEKY